MKAKKLALIISTGLFSLAFVLGFLPNILQASRFFENTSGISTEHIASATIIEQIPAEDEEGNEYYYLRYVFTSELDGQEYGGRTVLAYRVDAVEDQTYIDVYYNEAGESYETSYMLTSEVNFAYLAIPVVSLLGLSLSIYYLVKVSRKSKQ